MAQNPFQQYDSSEPIFWTSTTPGYNTPDRERWIVVDGKRVKEKIPQRAHVGDHTARRLAPGADKRWILMVRQDGHEGRVVMTNAAAHVDDSTGWAQDRRVKARFYGWYHPGMCPCALVATGELAPELVLDPDVRSAQPCKPGSYSISNRCPHSIAEQKARRAVHNAEQEERELKFKSKEDKVLEAMRSQTEALSNVALSNQAMQRKRDPKGE